MRSRLLVLVLVLGSLGTSTIAEGSSGATSLRALDEGAVSVKAKSGQDTARTQLTFYNASTKPDVLTIKLAASSAKPVAIASFAPKAVAPGEVTSVTVVLTGMKDVSEPATAQLVVKAGEEVVTRPLSIAPAPQPSQAWPEIIVIGAGVAILLLSLVTWLVAIFTGKWTGGKAPGPKWSFSSWATTLTAVGAILGTVLGSATLPDVAREADKDTLIRLNLLFGALVVVAPFVFQAIRSPKASAADQDSGLWGFSWSLLLACSITGGAVLGELGTFALLAWVLIEGGAWGWIAVGLIGILFGLAVYYLLVTAWSLATTDWSKVVADEKAATAKAVEGIAVGVAGPTEGEQGAEIRVAPVRTQRSWSLP